MWYNSGMLPNAAAALLFAPFVEVRLAPLTSINNPHPTLSVRVSLDAPGTWTNSIFENSRQGLFFVHQREDGRATVELVAHGLRRKGSFRKATVASTEKALAKIQAWIDANLAIVPL